MGTPITEEEKSRARYHLGYLEVEAASTFSLGVPAAVQTTFMVEGAFSKLMPTGAERFRTLLCKLDQIDERLLCGLELDEVTSIGEVSVNDKRQQRTIDLYLHYRAALGNLLGVPPNPFDQRFGGGVGGNGINIPCG